MKLRIRIAQVWNASSPLSGEGEVDESYFGARRVRGKKGRGAGGKTIVFGILERRGKQLQNAIRGQIVLDSIIHSDGWRGYNGLVGMGDKKYFRVHHGEHEFARSNCHIKSSMLFPDKRSLKLSRPYLKN